MASAYYGLESAETGAVKEFLLQIVDKTLKALEEAGCVTTRVDPGKAKAVAGCVLPACCVYSVRSSVSRCHTLRCAALARKSCHQWRWSRPRWA